MNVIEELGRLIDDGAFQSAPLALGPLASLPADLDALQTDAGLRDLGDLGGGELGVLAYILLLEAAVEQALVDFVVR